MKKYKNIFLSCLLIILSFAFIGCNNSTGSNNGENPGDNNGGEETPGGEEQSTYTVTFVDYDDTVLKTVEVEKGQAAKAPSKPTRENYVFIEWDTDFSNVTSDLTVKAVYHSTELTLQHTNNLKVDFEYQGKEFIKDGVGIVRINRVVDGDTISVYTSGASQAITIRFLGIDTPESTGSIEPWGKAASKYAKETLYAAESILLEAEGEERMDSGGKRYLAWVWYIPEGEHEYKLFNIEEVELAYAKYSQKVDSKYHDEMKAANDKAKLTQRRVWGEKDPNYSYSKEQIETTLLNLWYNHEKYQSGTYFYVTVRLVRTVGNNMYLEDAEEVELELDDGNIVVGKGSFYAFWGYSAAYYRYYNIGDVFRMRCQLEWDSDYGTQLTGVSKTSSAIANLKGEPEILQLDADELSYSQRTVKDNEGNEITANASDLADYMGKVVTVNNLRCVSAPKQKTSNDGTTYYTVVMQNKNGVQFDVYFSNDLITPWDVERAVEVGKTYSITGGIAYYQYANGYYQISVGDAPRYNNGVLDNKDILRVNDVLEMTK